MAHDTHRMTIGRLARAAGTGVETIRFYEREQLLQEPARTANGYRQYPPETVDQLAFIQSAKEHGFSLAEIRELLALSRPDGERARVKEIAEHKLADIDRRIEELRRMRAALSDLDQQCSGQGPVEGCPIIEALSGETEGE